MRHDLPSGSVTFLFTDVEGSTRLLHALGPEVYGEELHEHRRLIRQACTARGGTEVDTQGDAFFFAFSSASDALAAAAETQSLLSSTAIRVRIGIHSGQPHLTSEGYVGIDVHRAARIAASAHGGQVVVSSAAAAALDTNQLVSLGAHRLKDFSEPVTIYQLGSGSFPPLKTIANSNLPTPASSFLGREDELHEADLALRRSRLLTIHGPGGLGKTRFALELARRAREERFSDYEDGVFACFLAPLRDPELALPTIAQALTIAEQPNLTALEVLAAQLGDKRMLIVVDNVEHVAACAGDLAGLVASCPGLTLLATSREVLRVRGERVYELPPLADAEGVALFCERAQNEPTDAIRQICSRLEGIPLAIELAAARLRVLSSEQLVERLSQRLDLLKGPRDGDSRHRTLRATIEWSVDLLSPNERTLFARLSVFAGGCTLEAAEQVCDAHVDTLESLLDKSLLRRMDSEAGPRFWMLETIRDLAGEQLEQGGERVVLAARHGSWALAFAQELSDGVRGSNQGDWFKRGDLELENLRRALTWTAEIHRPDVELDLASRLAPYFMSRGRFSELAVVFDRTLPVVEDPATLARGLFGASWFSFQLGDHEKADAYAQQRLALARTNGDLTAMMGALDLRATIAAEREDVELAHRLYAERLEIAVATGDPHRHAHALTSFANFLATRGKPGEAVSMLEQAMSLGAGETPMMRSWIVGSLGSALRRGGNTSAAREALAQAIGLSGAIGSEGQVAWLVFELAFCLAADHEDRLAATLLASAEAVAEELEVDPGQELLDERQATRDVLQARLTEDAFDQAWALGRTLSLSNAVDLTRTP